MLSLIVSQLLSPSDHVSIYGHQDFASAMKTNNQSNSPSHIQEEGRFFSYEIIGHVNLLCGRLSSFIDLVINSLLPVVWANIIQLFVNNLRTIKIQNVPITYF